MQIDEEKALEALDGNYELLVELAQIFCEDAPVLLRDFERALDSGEAHAARLAAHSLKGLAATFYALPTVEAAYAVENECGQGRLEAVRNGAASKLEEMIDTMIDEIKSRGWVHTTN